MSSRKGAYTYILLLILLVGVVGTASASYQYNKTINVTGSAAEVARYQFTITAHNTTGTDSTTDIYMGNKVRSDWADLQVTDITGATNLSFVVFNNTATSATIGWNDQAIGTGTTQYNISYGASGQTVSNSNGYATFPLYDDFPGTTLNTSQWVQTGFTGGVGATGVSVANGFLNVTGNNSWSKNGISSTKTFDRETYPLSINFRWKTQSAIEGMIGYGPTVLAIASDTDEYYKTDYAVFPYVSGTSGTAFADNYTTNVLSQSTLYLSPGGVYNLSYKTSYRNGTYASTSKSVIVDGPYTQNGKFYLDHVFVRNYTGFNVTEPCISAVAGDANPVIPLSAATFTTNPASGSYAISPNTLVVQFTGTTTGATGWNWSFGDGTVSSEQNPLHTYSNIQSYRVNLTVTNGTTTNKLIVPDMFRIYEPLLTNFSSNYVGSNTITVNDTSTGFNEGSVWYLANASPEFKRGFSFSAFNLNDSSMIIVGGIHDDVIGKEVWTTTDGIQWSSLGNADYSPQRYHFAKYDLNGVLYITAGYGVVYGNDTWSSTDGVHWTQTSANGYFPARYEPSFWQYNGTMYFKGFYNGTFLFDVWSSTDGITWTNLGNTNIVGGGTVPSGPVKVVNNTFVAWTYTRTLGVTNNNASSYTASPTDPTQWTYRSTFAQTDVNWPGLEYNNKIWSIGGGDTIDLGTNETWFTRDGVTWYPSVWNASFPARAMVTPIVFKNKMWIIGGVTAINHTAPYQVNDTWYSPQVLYNWSWGDATANGTTANATHTYAAAGTYTVCNYVESIIANQTCKDVTVVDAIVPSASFIKSRPVVIIPQSMHIIDTSTNTPTMWNISWGDGGWSNTSVAGEQNASHTYTAIGTYTINLAVSNAAGSDSAEDTIPVYNNLTAAFTATVVAGSKTVQFINQSEGYAPNRSWAYNNQLSPGWVEFSNTTVDPSYTFVNGVYDINFTISYGSQSDSEIKTGYIVVTDTGADTPATTPAANPSQAGSYIILALNLIGMGFIVGGGLNLARMFAKGSGTMGRGDSSTPDAKGAILVTVFAILVGAIFLLITYVILGPLFTVAGV